MKRVMQRMMFSCKKATEMIEKNSIVGLSFPENIQLKMHTAICTACKKYESQSKIIDLVLAQIHKISNQNLILSKEKKEEIITVLENK